MPVSMAIIELHILHAVNELGRTERDGTTGAEVIARLQQRGLDLPSDMVPVIEGMRSAGLLTCRRNLAAQAELVAIRLTSKGLDRLRAYAKRRAQLKSSE
ncbi:MAG: hypothetical protein HYY04_14520 [Chloroflexi bacterium]|nr:hypothetical protein [Chloroflexota bacterium]